MCLMGQKGQSRKLPLLSHLRQFQLGPCPVDGSTVGLLLPYTSWLITTAEHLSAGLVTMNVRLRDNLTRDDRAALKGLQNRSIGYRLEYVHYANVLHFVTINCWHAFIYIVPEEDGWKHYTIMSTPSRLAHRGSLS